MSDIKVIVNRDDIVAIADAVRSKNGTTDEMTIGQIATGIEEISSGDTSIEDGLVTGTLTEYTNDRVTNIKECAFMNCTSLASANFPVCTTIGRSAFMNCTSLASANFPVCTTIGRSAFMNCTSLTSVNFPVCTTIGSWAFASCTSLTSVNLPVCTTIASYAFASTSLTSVNFPVCTTIGSYAFVSCTSLTSVNLPVCTTIYTAAFQYCKSLKTVSLPACTQISGSYVFRSCYYLTALYLTGSTVCTLRYSNAFSSTPIGGYSTSTGTYGYIYVPASLLASYQAATGWSYFSSRILAYDA